MEYRHLFCSHLFNVCIIFIHLTLYLSINVCVGVSVWVRVGVSAVEMMGVCMTFANFLPDFLDRMANQESIIWMLRVCVLKA